MTDFRTMFDRDYIGHFDLPSGKDLTVTIKNVIAGELTAVGGRKSKKPIVHFRENYKPLIANKTNCKTIASLYGNAVEQWKGKRVTLFVSTTRDPNGGGECECIRIRPKSPEGSALSDEDETQDAPKVTVEQALALDAACNERGINVIEFKEKAGVTKISDILADDYEKAMRWIDKKAKEMKAASESLATQA